MNIEKEENGKTLIKKGVSLEDLQREQAMQEQLLYVDECKNQEYQEMKLELKLLQRSIWEMYQLCNILKNIKNKKAHNNNCKLDPLLAKQYNSMSGLIQQKQDGIRRLEEEKYSQPVDREKLVVLHKYQESGVEVHHAYSKYIQSENLKSLRDLPHTYRLIVEDLELEIERKLQLKRSIEEQKNLNELRIKETRILIEEATSLHHSLQKQKEDLGC